MVFLTETSQNFFRPPVTWIVWLYSKSLLHFWIRCFLKCQLRFCNLTIQTKNIEFWFFLGQQKLFGPSCIWFWALAWPKAMYVFLIGNTFYCGMNIGKVSLEEFLEDQILNKRLHDKNCDIRGWRRTFWGLCDLFWICSNSKLFFHNCWPNLSVEFCISVSVYFWKPSIWKVFCEENILRSNWDLKLESLGEIRGFYQWSTQNRIEWKGYFSISGVQQLMDRLYL